MRELRIRWTGSALFDVEQAQWATEHAHWVSREYVRGHHTGFRKAVVYRGAVLGDCVAYTYYTPSGILVVQIHR